MFSHKNRFNASLPVLAWGPLDVGPGLQQVVNIFRGEPIQIFLYNYHDIVPETILRSVSETNFFNR